MLLALCSTLGSRPAWAQQDPGNSGSPGSGGEEGYAITGETNPKPTPAIFVYERRLPETDQQVYWQVWGAKTINGIPAEQWPEGSLDANDYPTLKIEWQDSIPGGRLALRTKVPLEREGGGSEVQERFFLWVAIAVVIYEPIFCNVDLQWSDGVSTSLYMPDYTNFAQSGLITDVCLPNIHSLHFRMTGAGNSCFNGARPFTFTFWYYTEQGHAYRETWSSGSEFIDPQFYDRIPAGPFTATLPRNNLQPESYAWAANWADLASTVSTVYTPASAGVTNPYNNERITRIRFSAVGRGCGYFGSCGDIYLTTGVLVKGFMAPTALAAQEILSNGQLGSAVPAGQALCVGRRYQLSAQPALGDNPATYDWTTDQGSVSPAAGLTTTLDLTSVTPANAPFQLSITASARAADPNCFSTSSPAAGTFYFRDTSQPQNLRLDGNPQICSTPAVRTIRVDAVAGATQYNWRIISGPGSFNSSVTYYPYSDLRFSNAGTVAVEVTAQGDCNRLSVPAAGSFSTADPNAVPAALPAGLLDGYYSWPWSYDPRVIGRLPISNPQSGIAYSFQVLSTELFNPKSGTTPSYYPSDPKSTAGPGAVSLTQPAGSTPALLEILSPRVASVTVQVTATNGCGSNGQTQIRAYYLTRPFYGSGLHRTAARAADDDEASQESIPQLYPNPTHDRLTIVPASAATHYEYVAIVNAQGQLVRELRSAEAAGVQAVDLQALPAGLYVVRLFDGKQFITQRVTKQ